jgi:hypothetical protein
MTKIDTRRLHPPNHPRKHRLTIYRNNSTFEILIINTIMTRSAYSKEVAAKPGPDLSVSGAVGSVLAFIPGVTAGIMGFIIFGTTSQFRRVYAQSLRKIFCCCGGGAARKSKNDTTDDVERRQTIGSGSSNALNGRFSGRYQTYHCRVESNGTKLEMGESGRIVAVREEEVVPVPVVVKSQEDKDLVIARAQEVLARRSSVRLAQPWRTLGIDRQVEREQHWNAFAKDTN